MTATKCDKCGGKGYLEFEAGLIRLRCETCKGKGENDDGNGTGIERTGQRIKIPRSKATRKYRKSRKSKIGKVS